MGADGKEPLLLSLGQYIGMVADVHPFVEREQVGVEISRNAVEGLEAGNDWTATSSPYISRFESTRSLGISPDRVDSYGLNVDIGRQFLNSGDRFSFSADHVYTDQNFSDIILPLPGGPVTIPTGGGGYYESSVGMTYIHPLGRNSGGINSRLRLDLARLDVEASSLRAKENIEKFKLDSGLLYIDWALAFSRLKIARARLELAIHEKERTARKRESNLVDKVDLIRAKDSLLASRQRVAILKSNLAGLEAKLKKLSAMRPTEKIEPAIDLYSPDKTFFPEVDKDDLKIETVRDIRFVGIAIKESERKIASFKNRTKAKIDLRLSAGLAGGAESLASSSRLDSTRGEAVIVFEYPLGNRGARADLASAIMERERLALARENRKISILSELANITARLEGLRPVIEADRNRQKSSKEKTSAELERYRQGRIEFSIVLSSRNEELGAENRLMTDSADYLKLVMAKMALTDKLDHYFPGGAEE